MFLNRSSVIVRLVMRPPTHSGWNAVSGCRQASDAGRRDERGRRGRRAGDEDGPEPGRQVGPEPGGPQRHRGMTGGAPGRHERCSAGGDEHQRHHAHHAIEEHDGRRQRLRPGGFAVSLMRTTSPPMLLGRRLLKKSATRNELSELPWRDIDVLRLEQQPPAPHAASTVLEVHGERDQRATGSRPDARSPTACRRRSARRGTPAARC